MTTQTVTRFNGQLCRHLDSAVALPKYVYGFADEKLVSQST